jgi:hypothetical protein
MYTIAEIHFQTAEEQKTGFGYRENPLQMRRIDAHLAAGTYRFLNFFV